MTYESSTLIVILLGIAVLVIFKITHTIVKEHKKSKDYFSRDDNVIDDFYTRRK